MMFDEHSEEVKDVLLICDDWSATREGIVGVNHAISVDLKKFRGLNVYSTIFKSQETLPEADLRDAEDHGVILISPDATLGKAIDMCSALNEQPLNVFPDLAVMFQSPAFIVGHAPSTAEAALKLKEKFFPASKVALFYHVIPEENQWVKADVLPYVNPTIEELIDSAERADVIFSVTDKVHRYFESKFRNKASKAVDHRVYHPQCSAPVFTIPRPLANRKAHRVLALCSGETMQPWDGLEIAALAVRRLVESAMEIDPVNQPIQALIVGGVGEDQLIAMRDLLAKYCCVNDEISIDVHSYVSEADLHTDLAQCSLCLVPSRCDVLGYVGLQALSSAIPTLISENSCLASLVKRLTSDAEHFLVPVTTSVSATPQDSEIWRERIETILRDPEAAHERAARLRRALKGDEIAMDSHDNVVTYCLDGIRLKHDISRIDFIDSRDAKREIEMVDCFNRTLFSLMKFCWRQQHHPLGDHGARFSIGGSEMPVLELIRQVTNKIEEHDRRIVGVDQEAVAFVVHCPTLFALRDLWAMCDRINQSLNVILFPEENKEGNALMNAFRAFNVVLRTVLSGPEFLEYRSKIAKMESMTAIRRFHGGVRHVQAANLNA